jgi:hypothetical protein
MFHVLDVDGAPRPEIIVCHACAGATVDRGDFLRAIAALEAFGPCPCDECQREEEPDVDEDP